MGLQAKHRSELDGINVSSHRNDELHQEYAHDAKALQQIDAYDLIRIPSMDLFLVNQELLQAQYEQSQATSLEVYIKFMYPAYWEWEERHANNRHQQIT